MELINRMLIPVMTVLISNLVTRIVTMGWLSPEYATQLQNWLMDGVAIGVPAIAAGIVGTYFTKRSLVAQAAALPEVTRLDVAPRIADKIDDATVRADPTAPS